MDTNLIPTQETALEHASPAARQSHQDQLQANREHVEKGRVVPPYAPVLTLEQRIRALEAKSSIAGPPGPAGPAGPKGDKGDPGPAGPATPAPKPAA